MVTSNGVLNQETVKWMHGIGTIEAILKSIAKKKDVLFFYHCREEPYKRTTK